MDCCPEVGEAYATLPRCPRRPRLCASHNPCHWLTACFLEIWFPRSTGRDPKWCGHHMPLHQFGTRYLASVAGDGGAAAPMQDNGEEERRQRNTREEPVLDVTQVFAEDHLAGFAQQISDAKPASAPQGRADRVEHDE